MTDAVALAALEAWTWSGTDNWFRVQRYRDPDLTAPGYQVTLGDGDLEDLPVTAPTLAAAVARALLAASWPPPVGMGRGWPVLLQALNKLFWKVPREQPDAGNAVVAGYWIAELADGGVHGIAWNDEDQAFMPDRVRLPVGHDTPDWLTVVLERGSDGLWGVWFAGAPGCHSQGATAPEALRHAAEALMAWQESKRIDEGDAARLGALPPVHDGPLPPGRLCEWICRDPAALTETPVSHCMTLATYRHHGAALCPAHLERSLWAGARTAATMREEARP